MDDILEKVIMESLEGKIIEVNLGEPTIHYSAVGCGCDRMGSSAQLYVIDPKTNQIMLISGSHPILQLMDAGISFTLAYPSKEEPARDPVRHIDTVLKEAITKRLSMSRFFLEIKDPEDKSELVQVRFLQIPSIPGLEVRREFYVSRQLFEESK